MAEEPSGETLPVYAFLESIYKVAGVKPEEQLKCVYLQNKSTTESLAGDVGRLLRIYDDFPVLGVEDPNKALTHIPLKPIHRTRVGLPKYKGLWGFSTDMLDITSPVPDQERPRIRIGSLLLHNKADGTVDIHGVGLSRSSWGDAMKYVPGEPEDDDDKESSYFLDAEAMALIGLASSYFNELDETKLRLVQASTA